MIITQSLDEHLRTLANVEARVLLVDDGSPDGVGPLGDWRPTSIQRVDILRLRRNLGHQRAICVGLCYIHDHMACDAVLVLDSDGEDRPEDAVQLIEYARKRPDWVTFAERRKRQEGFVFQFGYRMFRVVRLMLTGIAVRVGNFSVVPFSVLTRLVCMPELWNHFAGAVYKSKAHFDCVPMNRGKRLSGRSHMDLAALVAHGIAGIATFHEVVATLILITNVLGVVLLAAGLLAIAGIRWFADRAIPIWVAYAAGVVLVLAIQLVGLSFSLVFTLISNRSNMPFLPRRDYLPFVDRLEQVFGE